MADDLHEAESGNLDRLRAREALLSEAERIMRLGSFVWEPGTKTLWSDEFYRILGLEPGAVAPNRDVFYGAVHRDDLPKVLAARDLAANKGELPEIEYRVIRRDNGETRYIRSSGCVYRNPDGSVQRIIGALLDITESKRSALALEQAQAASGAAEELAQAGTFVVRWDPIEIQFSEGLRKLTGIQESTVNRDVGWSLIHPDDRENKLKWWWRLLETSKPESIQTRLVRPDGSVRHLYTRATLTTLSDGERVVGTTIDITERVQLEESLQRAAKLEAVGTLAAGVAHDFNNYLMAVGSALEHLPRADEPSRERLLVGAQRAVTRCAELTRQLLGFARCQPFAPELVDVRSVVDGLHELFRQSLGRRAALRVETAPGTLMARVDPRQLEQMLANLIVNAADAIEAANKTSGRVRVCVDQLQLTAASELVPETVGPGWYTRISVEDDGGGVSPDHLPRIFEPYFTTKPRGRGTGLGLSAVYGMAHQNGGVVTVEPLPDGTRFALWFPLPSASAPLTAAATELCRGRVLVVDDMPELRTTTAGWLREAGFETLEAEGGEAALAVLATKVVDLVLTDLQMPGLDGLALADEIERRQPDLPVVLMTGFASAAAAESPRKLLQKPFAEADLIAFVRSALR
ncbi:MAG TPA: PAS domain-containing protein [Polyangiales bacterium]|nr:PAS domain-containing protein [Polyangiales bacterium]